MDAVEHIEAPFAASFPLPFRVILLGGLGLLGWATNLHGLYLLDIDAAGALELRAHDAHSLSVPRLTAAPQDAYVLSMSVYRLFYAYAAWSLLGWAFFRYYTHGDPALVDGYKIIPAVFGLALVMALITPSNYFERLERDQFLLAVRRSCFSPANMPIYFSDVVLADIFTSFAKVIGDVWLSICMILPGGSLLIFPDQEGWTKLMVPCLMSVPYAIRFRQCVVEYMQPTNISRKPLYNALKYASSFPVIFLSAAQRIVVTELVAEKGAEVEDETWHGEHPLFRLWILSVAVNSLYSFWWDISNDWGLSLLRPESKAHRLQPSRPFNFYNSEVHNFAFEDSSAHLRHPDHELQNSNGNRLSNNPPLPSIRPHPWGLRPTLLFPLPAYPLAIFFNLILRLTWSIKLSSHLHMHASGAVVIFWIEVAELLRRWVWVFFRVEWECIKKHEERGHYAPEMEDLEMDATVGKGDLTTFSSEDDIP